MNTEINAWLTHKDYQQGLQLHQKYVQNTTVFDWLNSSPNFAKRTRLEEDLIKACRILKTEIKPVANIQKATTTKEQYPEDLSTDPEVIAIRTRKKEVFELIPKIKAKHNLMVLEESKYTNQERGENAKLLSDLHRELNSIWTKINHFRREGSLPIVTIVEPKIKELPTNLIDLIKKRNTLRSNLTKIKSGKRAASNLQSDTKQLEEIEALIKAHEANH